MNITNIIPLRAEIALLRLAISASFLRPAIVSLLERVAYHEIMEVNVTDDPEEIQADKLAMVRSIIRSGQKGLSRGLIGPNARQKLADIFLGKITYRPGNVDQEFSEKYGVNPPGFILISPTGRCNLKCNGCYAGSDALRSATLPYELVDRILDEKVEFWASHFTVISGGEPFLYEDNGKTLLDIFERHSDQYFVVFTNGTLISHDVAQRLGELGNVTTAVSVEGLEKETDERRGKGVFRHILKAFENLRNAGVPFGISTTAFRHNWEQILGDEFIEFFFEQQGGLYQWVFQYMPIGHSYTLEMMVTPEQRLRMFERNWELVRERNLMIADFWNSGTVSNGCIGAGGGHGGGYFYIDWNGTVSPCAFNPFSVDNIKDVYARGGDLNTVVFSSLFKELRKWQREYFYNKPNCQKGNLVVPCPIRDHHQQMREIIDKVNGKPIDENARQTLEDPAYLTGMVEYGKKFDRLTSHLWEERYMVPESKRMMDQKWNK